MSRLLPGPKQHEPNKDTQQPDDDDDDDNDDDDDDDDDDTNRLRRLHAYSYTPPSPTYLNSRGFSQTFRHEPTPSKIYQTVTKKSIPWYDKNTPNTKKKLPVYLNARGSTPTFRHEPTPSARPT